MKRRRLPKNVRRHHGGFRGVVTRDGVRIQLPTRATPDEAAADVARARGISIPRRVLTLQEGLDLVVEELELVGASPATIDFYERHAAALHTVWSMSFPLARITPDQVRRFIRVRQAAGIAPQTIGSKDLVVLGRIFRIAMQRGFLTSNPLDSVRRPRGRATRFDWIPAEEFAALLRAIREFPSARCAARDADLLELAFRTGLRRSELARLERDDIDLEAGTIHVRGKTNNRTVPIASEVRVILARLLASSGGARVCGTVRTLEKVAERWQERLDDPRLTWHALRHSFGSALARKGASAYAIRDLMRHKTLAQSARYLHSHGDELRAAAELVSLHDEQAPRSTSRTS